MKTSFYALWYGLLVVLLVACGGYEDDGAPPELLGPTEGSTSLFLAVEATTPSLRSSDRPVNGRVRQENLSRDAFRPVALVPDTTVAGGFREVEIDIFEFDNRGEGVYRVAIDGAPRVNVIIFATVNGQTFKFLVLQPGTESEPLVIDVETTAATELYIDAVAEEGDFSDIDLDEAEQFYEQTLDVMASSTPPPAGEDPVEYYKDQAKNTCDVEVTTGNSDCPRKVKGTVSGLGAGELRLELNGDEEIQIGTSGSFEFSELLPIGASFDVRVSRQPSAAVCEVTSGGAGVVGTNDSYAVTVTCAVSGSFTVGGTVSGLIGSLDLALNGDTETIDGNGFGSFDALLPTGTAYAVTIERQPLGQQCTLQNGTGVMGNANVTNITVTCVSDQFTIGGSVTGLTGSVTLLLNGGNALQVAGSGTQIFTFATPLAFASAYSVTVGSQPASQLCTVSGQTASGTVGTANISSVAVSCVTLQALVSATVQNGSAVSGTGSYPLGSVTTVRLQGDPNHYLSSASGCRDLSFTNSDQGQGAYDYPTDPLTGDCSIQATFTLKTYTVSANAQDGQITSAPSQVLSHGATTTITGSANQGYYLGNVTGCGINRTNTDQSVLTFNEVTSPITATCAVSAVFLRRTYVVTTTAGPGGQITSAAAPLVNFGSTTTVSVAANEGYYVSGIAGCDGTQYTNTDQSVSTRDYTTGTISGDCTVAATFTLKSYSVTTSITNGTLSPSTSPLVINHGATTQITATANAGYFIPGVTSDCGGNVPAATSDQARTSVSYTTGALTSACSVAVQTALRTPRSIGGTVFGLSNRPSASTGPLTLALKASAQGGVLGTTSINADVPTSAPFVFTDTQSNPVTRYSGETYAVEVFGQPPGMVCDVSQGAGTVGPGNVTNVEVFCTGLVAYLEGVWSRQTGDTLSLFRFRGDNSFLMASAAPSQPASTGFEIGSMFINESDGTVLDIGTQSDGLSGGLADPGFTKRISFRDRKLVITTAPEGQPANTTEEEWTRVQSEPQSLGGAWTGIEGRDSTFLLALFPATGKYMAVEPSVSASAQTCETAGLEYGSYNYSPQTASVTLSQALVDTNGCGGGHNPDGDVYQTLGNVSFVDLDGDQNVLEGWRLTPSGGSLDVLTREEHQAESFGSMTAALTGTWTSFQARTPTVTYPVNAREIYRFDSPDPVNQRISYMNGIVDSSHSGVEAGRIEYNQASGLLTVYTGLDTNGAFGGLNDQANVDSSGSPLPGTSFAKRYFVFFEFSDGVPVVLHTYDFIDNESRNYIRGPQRQSGDIVGTWVNGNVSFFSPMVMFFEDGTFFLLDPKAPGGPACSQSAAGPQQGIEFGNWSYTPPTLAITLSLPSAVADTTGCAGLWDSGGQVSNVAASSVLVDGGSSATDVFDDLLYIDGDPQIKVPNNGTVALQTSVTVGGNVSGLKIGEVLELEIVKTPPPATLPAPLYLDGTATQNLNFTFEDVPFDAGDTYQVKVLSAPERRYCSVQNAVGTVGNSNVTNVSVTCVDNPVEIGEIRPKTAIIGGILSVSGFGFTTGDIEVSLGGQAIDMGLSTSYRTNHEIRFLVPSMQPGIHALRVKLVSGSQDIGGDVATVGVADQFRITTDPSVRSAVAIGVDHTCAIGLDFNVYCWGFNGRAQLARNQSVTPESSLPQVVVGVSDARSVVAGALHSCALLSDTTVKCWGDNETAQLGTGAVGSPQVTPQTVIRAGTGMPLSGVTSLSAGDEHTCAVSSGNVYCWGSNQSGQIDSTQIGTSPNFLQAGLVFQPGNATKVVSGEEFNCALMSGGVMGCWGDNIAGQTGTSAATASSVDPASAIMTSDVRELAAGGDHLCVVLESNGQVLCRGSNTSAELLKPSSGPNALVSTHELQLIAGLPSYPSALSAGRDFNCVTVGLGSVQCWGSNFAGQLGDGTFGNIDSGNPVLPDAVRISTSSSYLFAGGVSDNSRACAAGSSGRLRCWGGLRTPVLRGDSQSAFGSYNQAVTLPLNNVRSIATAGRSELGMPSIPGGTNRTCTLTLPPNAQQANNAVYCSGKSGFLGDGGTLNTTVPKLVPGLGNPQSIASGDAHTCVSNADSTILCWGSNSFNAFGSAADFSSGPLLSLSGVVPSDPSTGKVLSAGSGHTCARSDTGLFCWGDNTHGQLGAVLTGSTFTPLQVAGLGVPDDFDLGGNTSCAIVGGSVQCWGDNTSRQLGNPSFTGPSSVTPTIVQGGGSNVTEAFKVAVGQYHGCAITGQTGEVRCWGSNSEGQLGLPPTGQGGDIYGSAQLVSGVSGAQDIAAGDVTTCVSLGTGGRVFCWGYVLQTAQAFTSGYVKGAGNVSGLSLGRFIGCGVVSNTEAQCWGRDETGELGIPVEPSYVRFVVPGI